MTVVVRILAPVIHQMTAMVLKVASQAQRAVMMMMEAMIVTVQTLVEERDQQNAILVATHVRKEAIFTCRRWKYKDVSSPPLF